jgi:hypothetical protein
MRLASLDVRRWNLSLAAVAAATLGCGPVVTPEGETDTDSDPPASTTYDEYYCADGTAGCCYYGACYYEPECFDDADCGPFGLCADGGTCVRTEEVPECESLIAAQVLELPVDDVHPFMSLAYVEVDGDPGQELVVGRLGRAELYLGAEPVPVELPGVETDGVLDAASGDLDGDGVLDLVLSTTGAGLLVMRGDGSGGFELSAEPAAAAPMQSLEALQWDGDGLLDLAGLTLDPPHAQIMRGTGMGSFAPPESLPMLATLDSLAFGRFDGDDLDDLVVQHGTSATTIYLGSPAGDVEGDTSLLGEIFDARTLLAGSIGGGPQDEVVALGPPRAGGWSLIELWPDATGTPRLYGLDGQIVHAALGDLDGDGSDDLVASEATSVTYVRGSIDASGAALSCRAPYGSAGPVDALAVGDLDGNGLDDMTYVSGGLVTVLLTQ